MEHRYPRPTPTPPLMHMDVLVICSASEFPDRCSAHSGPVLCCAPLFIQG